MNDELKQAFKILSDYCRNQPEENCIHYGNHTCELRNFCMQCINLPADFYTIYVEEEGL